VSGSLITGVSFPAPKLIVFQKPAQIGLCFSKNAVGPAVADSPVF
jgi:hypothetical protein